MSNKDTAPKWEWPCLLLAVKSVLFAEIMRFTLQFKSAAIQECCCNVHESHWTWKTNDSSLTQVCRLNWIRINQTVPTTGMLHLLQSKTSNSSKQFLLSWRVMKIRFYSLEAFSRVLQRKHDLGCARLLLFLGIDSSLAWGRKPDGPTARRPDGPTARRPDGPFSSSTRPENFGQAGRPDTAILHFLSNSIFQKYLWNN